MVGRLLFDFNVEFDTPTPSAEEFARRFANLLVRGDVVVLLAGEVGKPEGFAFLMLRPTPYGDGPLAQLEELYVRPRLRGRGIGAELLAAAVGEVGRRGAVEMHIEVDEDDVDTRRFYERYGFFNVPQGTESRMLCYLRDL